MFTIDISNIVRRLVHGAALLIFNRLTALISFAATSIVLIRQFSVWFSELTFFEKIAGLDASQIDYHSEIGQLFAYVFAFDHVLDLFKMITGFFTTLVPLVLAIFLGLVAAIVYFRCRENVARFVTSIINPSA